MQSKCNSNTWYYWSQRNYVFLPPLHLEQLQWNLSKKKTIFIQEIVFENVVGKLIDILSRPHSVNDRYIIATNKTKLES